MFLVLNFVMLAFYDFDFTASGRSSAPPLFPELCVFSAWGIQFTSSCDRLQHGRIHATFLEDGELLGGELVY